MGDRIGMYNGRRNQSYIGGSEKFKYVMVYKCNKTNKIYFRTNVVGMRRDYETERECAIAVDKCLIKQGKSPVNILKAK